MAFILIRHKLKGSDLFNFKSSMTPLIDPVKPGYNCIGIINSYAPCFVLVFLCPLTDFALEFLLYFFPYFFPFFDGIRAFFIFSPFL